MGRFTDRLEHGVLSVETTLRRHNISWRLLYRLAIYILLINVAYVFLFPFIYMLITSVKSPQDLANFSVNWVPRELYWDNYGLAFATLRYRTYFRNSVIITAIAVIGHLFSGSVTGYAFARYRFPGSRILFSIVILSLILPIQTLIVPMYMLYSNLGWIDSYLPLLVPVFFGYGLRGGLFIFIFRQFFVRLPHELEDAAKIDGCSFIRTFWNIVIPISQPALLVSGILSMVWHWHDFYEPSIYLRKARLLPLTAVLPRLFQMLESMEDDVEALVGVDPTQFSLYNDAMAMAATVLVVLPILIVFMVLQRYFIQGVERTGLVE